MYNSICLIFTWDTVKAGKNFNKHHVSFEEAKSVWADPNSKEYMDQSENSRGETRFYRIGISTTGRILTLIFTEPDENEIRLISARKSTNRERNKYGRRIRLL